MRPIVTFGLLLGLGLVAIDRLIRAVAGEQLKRYERAIQELEQRPRPEESAWDRVAWLLDADVDELRRRGQI